MRAKKAGVSAVVFDRGGFLFHGRVKALADAAAKADWSSKWLTKTKLQWWTSAEAPAEAAPQWKRLLLLKLTPKANARRPWTTRTSRWRRRRSWPCGNDRGGGRGRRDDRRGGRGGDDDGGEELIEKLVHINRVSRP